MYNAIPMVVEQSGIGERAYDIFSRLLRTGSSSSTGRSATPTPTWSCPAALLGQRGSRRDISLYINSPGGSVTAGLAIYDTIQYLHCDVQTICMGQACSMAALLLACGEGKRWALPSSRVMIHQPWGGVEGQAADIAIQAREIGRLKQLTIEILARHTKRTIEEIARDVERDFFLAADDAVSYRLVDNVMKRSNN